MLTWLAPLRSLRVDWPVLRSERQHVQALRAPEHAWEDGDSWRTPLNDDDTVRVGAAAHARYHHEEVIHAERLTTIMGVSMNALWTKPLRGSLCAETASTRRLRR